MTSEHDMSFKNPKTGSALHRTNKISAPRSLLQNPSCRLVSPPKPEIPPRQQTHNTNGSCSCDWYQQASYIEYRQVEVATCSIHRLY